MLVLGIETSCDETACAVVEDGKKILSNVIVSQIDLHSLYGGVYPELAFRRHFDLLIPTVDQALKGAGLSSDDIDLISVAQGPGLMGALVLGVNTAKALSLAWDKPFVGVNHVEAHLYSALMGCEAPSFPSLGVVVSGGHTFLALMSGIENYEIIGQTVDDAIGESFDKVASMLGLPYPGGAQIEQLACQGDPLRYPFKAGKVKGNQWNFSFSGIKTNVLYTIKGKNKDRKAPDQIFEADKPDIAASFQEAVLSDVVVKTLSAAAHFKCKMILMGGGVTSNQRLRDKFLGANLAVYWPLPGLSMDNGAMIAGLGYHLFVQKKYRGDDLSLEPFSRTHTLKKHPQLS